MSINLRPIWNSTNDIYSEVVKICDKHHLRYYLTDGSAIGAIRHRGPIPWDDDFDMSMPREDYSKFIKYAKVELPKHLKFLDWHNCPEFCFLFGKVQDCRKDYVEKIERESGQTLSNGLYVDIFPIDGYPTNRYEILFTRIYAYLLRALWRARFGVFKNQSPKGKMLCLLGWAFACFVPWIRKPEHIMMRCENMLLRHRFHDSDYTSRASVYLTGLNRPPLPKKWWGDQVWVDYDGMKVPLPHDYDNFLRFYYGDYMKLPPVEKRVPSHSYAHRCGWWLGPTKEI